MTLFLSSSGLGILVAASFLVGFVVGKRYQAPPLTLEKVRHAVELRVAVHEVGHAVVAWHCPYTTIDTVEMDEGTSLGRGRVRNRMLVREGDLQKSRWWEVALRLGGIAGELVELGKTRSGNCLDDLNRARDAAQGVLGTDPPWREAPSSTFDPVKMFRTGSVTEAEARVLRICYDHARSLILKDREVFNRLVHDLMEKAVLREEDVRAAFWSL